MTMVTGVKPRFWLTRGSNTDSTKAGIHACNELFFCLCYFHFFISKKMLWGSPQNIFVTTNIFVLNTD